MSEQLIFPGFPRPSPITDRLFFAVAPAGSDVEHIVGVIQQLRDNLQLTGQPLSAECLHVSLHAVGDYQTGAPDTVVQAAMKAGSSVLALPFEIQFDSAMSFYRKERKRAFVLRPGGDTAALKALHSTLGESMQAAGVGRGVTSHFAPHMTMLYDTSMVAELRIGPLRWSVTELVLVHSLVGQGRHIRLARWPLRG